MIKAENISIGYRGRIVAKEISFTASRSECILLCGANGSGKTTLLRTIAGLQKPLEGTIKTDGTVVMIPAYIPKVRGFTMREFILTGCYRETNLWGRASTKAKNNLGEASSLLGIERLLDKDISAASDGEFRKACIASAFVQDADTVLLDEPTAYLDVDSRALVLRTLNDIAKRKNVCIIFSSHDIMESYGNCDRVLGIGKEGKFLDSEKSTKMDVLYSCFESLKDGRRLSL